MYDANKQRASRYIQMELPKMQMAATWREHSTDLRSDETSETYEGLGDWPAVKEFLNERSYESIGQADYTIKSKEWELSFEMKKKDMKREKGKWLIQDKLPKIAQAFASHPNGLMFALLEDFTSTKTMDRLTFFNAAHTIIGSTRTYSNLLSGSGVTAANIINDYHSALELFALMVKRSGEPLFEDIGQLRFDLFHPRSLNQVMKEVFVDQRVAGSTTVGRLSSEPVTLKHYSRLVDQDNWYLKINNIPGFQPFFMYIVEEPKFMWNDSKDNDFKRKTVQFGGDGEYSMAYAYPETMVAVVN